MNQRDVRSSFHPHKKPVLCCLSSLDDTNNIMEFGTPIALVTAIILLVAAQGFINTLTSGNQGLGAFLKDGSGYNKSAFTPFQEKSNSSDDPLPWLKLPTLDFVDVAGQEEDNLQKQLQDIRIEMNEKLQEGNVEEATMLRDKLQVLMEQNGFQYEADESLS